MKRVEAGVVPPSIEAERDRSRSGDRLSTGMLGTADIVFTVMAVSAPLAVVVALMPLALALGNGAGVPGTWLLAMMAMVLFGLGYVRIIPYVRNAGAFYAYIAASIGKRFGLAAAYIAALCYFALSVSTLAAFAFYSSDILQLTTGVSVPWPFWGEGCAILVGFLAYHRITFAAKVLGFALVAEVLIMLVLVAAIAFHQGPAAYQLTDFAPAKVFAPGLGVALIYAFNSLIGFEGTAIYQEEAKDPARTIPRATFISIGVTGGFYVLVSWSLSTAVGSATVSEIVGRDPGHFVTDLAGQHLGLAAKFAFSILVLTSAMAAVLALFNNTARYIYALARDGVLPAGLARTHPRHGSPHRAVILLTFVLIGAIAICAGAELDPLLNVSTALVGLGSVGLMILMATTSLAIPVFFIKRRIYGWRETVAPALGGLLILTASVLALNNYELLTGVTSTTINSLPWLLVVLAAVGFGQAQWLRSRRPETYARIGKSQVEEIDAVRG